MHRVFWTAYVSTLCSTTLMNYLGLSLAVQSGGGEPLQAPVPRLIQLLLVVYIYDDLQDTFKHLPSMPAHIPVQIHNARKALQLVDTGTLAVSCLLSVCVKLSGHTSALQSLGLELNVKKHVKNTAHIGIAYSTGQHGTA